MKVGREYAGSRVFGSERAAYDWERRTKARLDGGRDLRAGKVRVGQLVKDWLVEREASGLSRKTIATDALMAACLSPALAQLNVDAVTARHLTQWYAYLAAQGLAHGSIARYRQSLSACFAWAVADMRIEVNPVALAPLPRGAAPAADISPFDDAELADVLWECRERHPLYADVVLVLARTGLRWGELRALRVRDFQLVPRPALLVSRSRSELPSAVPVARQTKGTKGGRSRRVPVADVVAPILAEWAYRRPPNALLVVGDRGGPLWRGTLVRALDWGVVGRGRRLHDLRHTAAVWWLNAGIPLSAVSAWLGHANVQVTSRVYMHYLGDSLESAGLDLLNRAAAAGPKLRGDDDPGWV